MTITLKNTFTFAVILALFSANIYFLAKRYNNTHFECDGDVQNISGSKKLAAKIILSLSGDEGYFIIDGTVTDNSRYRESVRRIAFFKFTQKYGDLYATNYSNSTLVGHNASESLQNKLLPDYALHDHDSYRLSVSRLENNRIIITQNSKIILFCTEN